MLPLVADDQLRIWGELVDGRHIEKDIHIKSNVNLFVEQSHNLVMMT